MPQKSLSLVDYDPPHTEHVDQMLFRQIILLVHIPLQRRKDHPPVLQSFTTGLFQHPQLVVWHARRHVRFGQGPGFRD